MADELPEVSTAQRAVAAELCGDLARQLDDGLAMPAVMAADESGNILVRALMPLDGDGPVPDHAIGQAVLQMLEQGGELDAAAAIGFVRVDLSPPEVITYDFATELAYLLRPEIADSELGFVQQFQDGLSGDPRGGGEDGGGAVLANTAARTELEAAEALNHIGNDALGKLKRAIEAGGVTTASDVPDDLMFDAGPVWGHENVPDLSGAVQLSERLVIVRDFARQLPTETSVTRFTHDDRIYLFGLFSGDQGETTFLLRMGVQDGQLLGPEEIRPEEQQELLRD